MALRPNPLGTKENPLIMDLYHYELAKKEGAIEDEIFELGLVKAIGLWWRYTKPARISELKIPSEEERRENNEFQKRMLELWKVD